MNDLTDTEFRLISEYIKTEFGINLGSEKKGLIYSRLRQTVVDGGFKSFGQYFETIKHDKNGKAIIEFINKITTNHTFFMREAEHFDYFKKITLPNLEKKYSSTKDLRLWCSGCSSGEEVYILMIIILEFFASKEGWNIDILATDISSKVLDKAVKGIYTNESLNVIPKDWKLKYFKPFDAKNSVVVDSVKKHIMFRKINLMDDKYNFKKKLQVIFCRNVMIYFDNQTKSGIANKFHDALDSGGYLFIGHSESLNQLGTKFVYESPAIYRKK